MCPPPFRSPTPTSPPTTLTSSSCLSEKHPYPSSACPHLLPLHHAPSSSKPRHLYLPKTLLFFLPTLLYLLISLPLTAVSLLATHSTYCATPSPPNFFTPECHRSPLPLSPLLPASFSLAPEEPPVGTSLYLPSGYSSYQLCRLRTEGGGGGEGGRGGGWSWKSYWPKAEWQTDITIWVLFGVVWMSGWVVRDRVKEEGVRGEGVKRGVVGLVAVSAVWVGVVVWEMRLREGCFGG